MIKDYLAGYRIAAIEDASYSIIVDNDSKQDFIRNTKSNRLWSSTISTM